MVNQVEPFINFDGIDATNSTPPDPSMAVGKDHVLQMVNATFIRIYDKEGNPVTNEFSANTFWSGTGFNSAGDPIVLYDHEADRWMITEFAPQGANTLLIAISETEDPTGSYFIYDFQTPNFPDYPKFGIWPEAYIIGTNELPSVPVYALEREKMLAGEEDVTMIRVTASTLNSAFFPMLLPSDWEGATPPPADTKPMFLRVRDGNFSDAVQVYTLNIDWDNPNNSSLDFEEVEIEDVDTDGCVVPGFFTCLPQPSGEFITGFPGLIMERIQYRNFEDYEILLMNFMVNSGTTADPIAGIRWVELRRLPGETDWSLYQEGTFAPGDGNHRFLGGIAMDGDGNIGLAYSITGEDKNPSLAFTGRRNGDPLGEMSIEEFEFMPGGGSVSGFNRFGDYCAMRVDPDDDQSFWYTGEYGLANSSWATRIVGFVIRRDTVDMAATQLIAPQSAELLSDTETITATFTNAGFEDQQIFEVGFILDGAPAVIEPIDMLLSAGESFEYSFTQTGDFSAFGDHDLEIFVNLDGDTNPFNDTLRQVVERIPRRDLASRELLGLNSADCKDTVLVDYRFANLGLDSLFSANINWQINNGPVTTIPWTGGPLIPNSLSSFIEVQVYGFVDGFNEVKFFMSDPNGLDDQVASNDTIGRTVEMDLGSAPILVTIKFDFLPEETSWELRSDGGDLIFEGGPYTEAGSFSQVQEEFCLDPAECYVFTIFDSNGDGIALVPGFYSITDGSGNILASLLDPAFGSEEVHPFCATFDCNVQATADVADETFLNAMDGSILVSLQSGGGPFEYSLDGGDFQESNLFENLSAGDYTVTVQDANGCTTELSVSVGVNTSVENVIVDYSVQIFPNPTKELFRINITGLEDLNFLNFQILDVTGKVIQNRRLQRYGDVLTAQLSLKAYPAGMYFVKFEDERLNQLVRVVKQ